MLLARQLLDLATNQRNSGIATGLDVARAETRLAGQQVQLAQARTNLDTARLNLLRIIGSPLSAQLSPADAMRFEPQPAQEAGEAIRQALGGRLELSVARRSCGSRKRSGKRRWGHGRPRSRHSGTTAAAG